MGNIEEIENKKQEYIKEKNWIFEMIRKKQSSEEKNELKQLVTDSLSNLRKLKVENPQEFEQLYWKTKADVIRSNVYKDSYYQILWCLVTVVVAVVGTFFSITKALEKISSGLDLGIVVCVAVMAIIVIWLTVPYFRFFCATRERAYNELILSEMEKIKEEENECIVRNVEVK